MSEYCFVYVRDTPGHKGRNATIPKDLNVDSGTQVAVLTIDYFSQLKALEVQMKKHNSSCKK